MYLSCSFWILYFTEQSRHKTKRSRRAREQQQSSSSLPDMGSMTEESRSSNKPQATTTKCSNVVSSPLCKYCGQRHRLSENHEYDYTEVVPILHCESVKIAFCLYQHRSISVICVFLCLLKTIFLC